MKKVLVVLGVLGLFSCKKVCNCITVTEMGKPVVVKGETVMAWKVVDTVGVGNDCSNDGNITMIAPTLRNREVCD
jgi:hypothetical protein